MYCAWLPRGTHQYEKLVRPEEVEKPLAASGMETFQRTGVFFSPITNQWNLSRDMGRQLHAGGAQTGLSFS